MVKPCKDYKGNSFTTFSKVNRPRTRGVYGCPHGTFRGEIWTYIESNDTYHYFLSMPKMVVREVPHNKFDFGVKNSIIDFIEELPRTVFKVVEAQYKKSKNEQKRDTILDA